MSKPKYEAVLFDLLTGLLDSGTLWNAVAGKVQDGRRWRTAYLEMTYRAGAYRSYEKLVAEAAVAVGLAPTLAGQLAARYDELRPWPEVSRVLGGLRFNHLPLAVVTNCSDILGAIAVAQVGIPIDVVVTAERAGFYKPDPRPYQMALDRLGLSPARCLFVAGSAFDLIRTGRLGIPTFWHDRIGMVVPSEAAPPFAHKRTLDSLIETVLGPVV